MSDSQVISLNSSFDRAQFLREYWQQKPLLIKDFVPGFEDLLGNEELAGLACEEEIESRLVTEPETGQWLLEQGPLPESRLDDLGDSHWTLLVQALDQWLPAAAELRAAFNFLPQWRIDDVMVSFAAPQGSVGPHFDHYDVFLLQGSGSRRWQVGQRCDQNTATVNANGLNLLEKFSAEHSYDLAPGDALYLPPRFAHWGTALSAGQCYSIGFRAPSLADMLEGFSDSLIDIADPGDRFADQHSEAPDHPGLIDSSQLDAAFVHLQQQLANRPLFDRWFGCAVTQAKYPEQILPPQPGYVAGNLEQLLADHELLRHPGSRFAYMPELGTGKLRLFADGESWLLKAEDLQMAQAISDASAEPVTGFTFAKLSEQGQTCLLALLNKGSLVLLSDD